MILGRGEKAA